MVYKRKKYHYGDTHLKRRWQTKRRTKDLDQIDEDLKPESSSQLLRQDVDFDKPGGAQHYCLHCARYFINSTALQDHFKTKVHKRRLKALELEPYTIEESERAAGFGNWKTPNKRKIETQLQNTDEESEDSPNKKMKIDEESRNFSSALYITGDKAQKTFSVLTPVIDFEKQLQNKDILVKNLNARGMPINLEKIEKRWQFFQSVTDQKRVLESTRIEIARLIAALMEDTDKNKDEIEKLKLHSKLVKEDLKNLKDFYYGLEEGTMLQVLNLPNILHERTPIESVTLHSFLEASQEKSKCHMEIGEKNGFIKYINPITCYFKSDAALYEIGMLNYFRRCLLDSEYTQFSNPDFCRSVIVEGCGDNYEESSTVFTLEEQDESKGDDINRLHLCGAASLYSFMAYFTRHSVQQTQFPLKYFSLGKKYQPSNSKLPNDLFNLSQEAVLNIFIATLEEVDILEEITKEITTLYESLGYHFRLIISSARDLDKSESLRLSVQMYSNHLEHYLEVGNVSLYDSYLSKRLLFTYSVGKERKYPKIIAGTLLNIPRLLGCVLENNSVTNQDLITGLVRKHIFV